MKKRVIVFILPLVAALGTEVAYAATPASNAPGDLIRQIYLFALAIGGLLAMGMIIIGAFEYITSAGNASRQSNARDRMLQALIGLLLLVGAYIILYTINPNLVKLSLPDPTDIVPAGNVSHNFEPPEAVSSTVITSLFGSIEWGYPDNCGFTNSNCYVCFDTASACTIPASKFHPRKYCEYFSTWTLSADYHCKETAAPFPSLYH